MLVKRTEAIFRYYVKAYSHFDRSKIPGPRAWPFIGTTMEIYLEDVSYFKYFSINLLSKEFMLSLPYICCVLLI